MTTVTVDDEVQTRFRAVAGPDEALDAFVAAATKEALRQREAARAELQAALDAPRHPFDPDATYQKYKAMFGWRDDDFSHLSGDELIESGDRLP